MKKIAKKKNFRKSEILPSDADSRNLGISVAKWWISWKLIEGGPYVMFLAQISFKMHLVVYILALIA